ncbi:hypothetical protein ACFOWE_31320 [Planomonospora corallina]|uniref:Uncharacterized protein n=1 Tax=Planomonospora corallina TaxID=1806052 RepID=A0ABV8IEZ9_9ACTN
MSIDEILAVAPTLAQLTAGTCRVWHVQLPPGLPLINANRRIHHMQRAKLTKVLRREGRKAVERARVPALERAHIFGIFCPEDNGHRDVGNWYPSFKGFVDGVVDAGVLPDDDDTHLIGPDMRRGPVVPGGQLRLLIVQLPDLTPGPAPAGPGPHPIALPSGGRHG